MNKFLIKNENENENIDINQVSENYQSTADTEKS